MALNMQAPPEEDVTNLVLLPTVFTKLTIPIVASGGIATGSQMAAVMVLGAEGVNMGTRFVATQEAPVHENMKQAIVEARETDTTLMFRALNSTARVFKNVIAKQVVAIEAKDGSTDFSDLQPLVAGARGRERYVDFFRLLQKNNK
ncbi:NAD(P)H-dependent flavin oxidoreductase [Colwellia sp. 20A7]|uniref:NAD(P)H-dependent flavin oxidoreductase n=1 Tax=Colwellia sp. 20A7 TaxID=2689569 RepID=UPI0019168E4E|nr:nitronate monooxygenase [Colwellia sp. 20A7]